MPNISNNYILNYIQVFSCIECILIRARRQLFPTCPPGQVPGQKILLARNNFYLPVNQSETYRLKSRKKTNQKLKLQSFHKMTLLGRTIGITG